MSKKDLILDFIKQNPISAFPTMKAAYEAFCLAGNDASYTRFSFLASNPILLAKSPIKETPEVIVATKHALTNIEEIHFDDSILVPIKTNTAIDRLLSYEGGVMPATITLVPGASGCGKTTLLLFLFGAIKAANPNKKILFVSSEMNSIHMFKYGKRINIKGIDILMLSESETPKAHFESALLEGWDVVILDSLADTINKIRLETGDTENKVENFVLKTMDAVRRGENATGAYTAFFCTHHMTKAQTYTGSTNLKHMTDGMMELKTIDNEPNSPFIEYSKNRDGKIGLRLYYTIHNNGIEFNEKRMEMEEKVRENVEQTTELIKNNEMDFETLFLSGAPVIPAVVVNVDANGIEHVVEDRVPSLYMRGFRADSVPEPVANVEEVAENEEAFEESLTNA